MIGGHSSHLGLSGGLWYHLHEVVRWSLIRRSRQFSDPCCRQGGGVMRSSRLVVSLLRCGGEM